MWSTCSITRTVLLASTRRSSRASRVWTSGHVQAGGGFVQDVDGAGLVEFISEFEALAFAAGQSGQRLARALSA